jgi:(4-(4-[2-(gamma-L-glutamylamino)ethyl]phenoxymethyl)furan-2-yl)methanamine synthase
VARLHAAHRQRAADAPEMGAAGPRGLLIDVGSTTTDIIPIAEGRPGPRGSTDLERLQSGELVYTGLLRTPPATLADRVPVGERWCRVSPEHFTIMADAQVVLGSIGPEAYTTPTPDGRGRSRAECAARLARLVCSEPSVLGEETLLRIAAFLADRQIALIVEAAHQVAGQSGAASAEDKPLVIAAGCGWFLARSAAESAGWPALRLSRLMPSLGEDWDVAAPAAALAILLAEAHGELLLGATATA